MNMLFILLQEAPAPQGGGASMWIMILLIFAVMYFFMIRPQNKQRKELQKFLDALKKGDKVVTIGGMHGVVKEVKEDKVILEVDKDVCLTFNKGAVQGPAVPPAAPKKESKKEEKKEEEKK